MGINGTQEAVTMTPQPNIAQCLVCLPYSLTTVLTTLVVNILFKKHVTKAQKNKVQDQDIVQRLGTSTNYNKKKSNICVT